MDIADKKMVVVNEDGTKEEVELLFAFEFNDTKKEYAVYTQNEKDESGNSTIYVSSVLRDGEQVRLGGIESDEEWSKIKDVLRELSKKE